MGLAVLSVIQPLQFTSTIEMKVNYLRPTFKDQLLEAEATILHVGRTQVVLRCDVKADGKKLIATGTGTYNIYTLPNTARL